jgi:hypothetical protein
MIGFDQDWRNGAGKLGSFRQARHVARSRESSFLRRDRVFIAQPIGLLGFVSRRRVALLHTRSDASARHVVEQFLAHIESWRDLSD